MGTARTIVVLLLVAASSLWFNPSVAGADCAGPTIDHQGGEVSPGSTVVVEGLWWGDNCYDTGPPPDGEDILGKPLQGIDVFIVQGELDVLVATGDAGPDYGFLVNVTVPSGLAAGKFSIEARAGLYQAWNQSEVPLVFLPDDVEVVAAVAAFEPPIEPVPFDEVDIAEIPEDDTDLPWLIIGAVGIIVILGLSGIALTTRRR